MVSEILMIAPDHFGFNPETASDNHFQLQSDLSPSEIESAAHSEFEEAVSALRSLGIVVHVIQSPSTSPDAVFPNNWISFHTQGYVLYPMRSAQRSTEILSQEIIAGFSGNQSLFYDLRASRTEDLFLEGTGSLVLDRNNKTAFACLSPRTSPQLLNEWAHKMDYSVIAFTATDLWSRRVYHTNVLMAIGPSTAIFCDASISSTEERKRISSALGKYRQIVEINMDQLSKFAGNAIFLQAEESGYWIMSKTAFESMRSDQIDILEKDGPIVSIDIPTIEQVGGGSIRCMICEMNADDISTGRAPGIHLTKA
jgi:hypothetical protein